MKDFAFIIMIYHLKQAVVVIVIKRTKNFANFSRKCNNCAWLVHRVYCNYYWFRATLKKNTGTNLGFSHFLSSDLLSPVCTDARHLRVPHRKTRLPFYPGFVESAFPHSGQITSE